MEEQMTKYKIRLDMDKAWDPTLNHFSKLFMQRKAYGNNRAANRGFKSAAAMYYVPSNSTITTTQAAVISPHVTSTLRALRSH
jgi:hypothetical protein